MVVIIVGNPDSSNEIYISIEQDHYGSDQVLSINGHEHINKRHASSAASASSKRIRLSKELDLKEKDILFYKDKSPLGLKLQKTPSLINSIEMKLLEARKKEPKLDHEKLKASNFPAKLLQIGTWMRPCRNEGDLIAKCYYAKKKIVWEILEGALKRKIEIQWSDIIGINATVGEDRPGVLELELKHPPTYFLETNPQPRKHTLWQTSSDFTGGQAPSFRRHFVTFPPGILDKHYEKLLQCDQRLFELSQKTFPTLPHPYFDSNNLYGFSEHPCNLDRDRVSEILPNEMQQHQVQKFPTPLGQRHQLQNMKATTNAPFPCNSIISTPPGVAPEIQYHDQNFRSPVGLPLHLQNLSIRLNPHPGNADLTSMADEMATNYVIENQSTVFFNQGTNIIQGPSSVINISQVNSGFLYQHLDGQEVDMGNPLTNISGISFAETANNQLGDTNLITEQGANPNINNNFANKMMSHEQQCYLTNNHVGSKHAVDQYCEANGLMLMPKPLSWLPQQELNASTTNLSLYPYHVFHEPSQQDVETQSPTHHVHPWG
ncbi:hypothetical protein POM88_039761 [Heracleum sosnowskyi]|uniref:TRF2/HOY1 PH-like domain-containing protein n=1 Tax=Heracleum sosnowskyi TaxID=360622 RepID=A0AAD8M6Q5_9APIA|nr:hypothetical protein POM88_039761 [Heracleum sosnowskyi]